MLLHNASETRAELTFHLIMADASGETLCFPLHEDQIANIGRASTNRIVLTDEKCSRYHCEVFHSSTGWKLRDRSSRNGTYVNFEQVKQDHALAEGDLIRIGHTLLRFTSDVKADMQAPAPLVDGETSLDMLAGDHWDHSASIVRRQKRSSYRDAPAEKTDEGRSGLQLSRLYQMALEMGNTKSAQELADIVLDGLVGITGADIGAVLMRQDYGSTKLDEARLERDLVISSYRSLNGETYKRVSRSLSQQVFETAEAILAFDVSQTEGLTRSRDSLNDIQAKSLIVAPILDGSETYGLIHLYSTNLENPLDADSLDYTLAVADQLAVALKNLQQRQSLQEGLKRMKSENLQLRQQLAIESELVGRSAAMQQLRETISLVAPTDAVVLIRGESGVGKELVARAIHDNSRRKEAPFVCMNCAALSESLLESELFGHEKGSFTGATGQKPGKFEQAHKGTLFLDEVGEMSPSIQAKFLRVLEGHPFERVGGSTSLHVDVRLVAATNRNLEEAVRQMTFRKDLYFRLQVLEIVVPPLRDRGEDIPVLADYFARRLAQKTGRRVHGFSPSAMARLMDYHWPGNIRELQNTVERAVVLCAGEYIESANIQLSKLQASAETGELPAAPSAPLREQSMEEVEKGHILRTLELTEGNKSRAAQILGIERSTLDRKLKKYGLKVPRET